MSYVPERTIMEMHALFLLLLLLVLVLHVMLLCLSLSEVSAEVQGFFN